MVRMSNPWVQRESVAAPAARQLIDAAVAEAASMSVAVTVAVVDASGCVTEIKRMDGAPMISVEIATDKAHTAATIGLPPDEFFHAIEADAAAVTYFGTRRGLALMAGGLPIQNDGNAVGGIGVAGAMTGADDRRIAEIAIAALGL